MGLGILLTVHGVSNWWRRQASILHARKVPRACFLCSAFTYLYLESPTGLISESSDYVGRVHIINDSGTEWPLSPS
jgi:hypothetical protein